MKNKKGAALIVVILVLLVLGLLISALWGMAAAEVNLTARNVNNTQAHYLGRSGIYSGIKLLESNLASTIYKDMNILVSSMNSIRSLLPASSFEIAAAGKYTLEYTAIDSTHLKITSIGTTNGSSPRSEKITLTMKIGFPINMTSNPKEWVSGINLSHGVITDIYLGKGVTLEGNPIQSPQGGNSDSFFISSVILFTDSNGKSLRQINNSVNVTFRTEVMYFQSGVQMNAKGDKIYFEITDDVLNNRLPGKLASYKSTPPVGFENADRYMSFNQDVTETNYINYGSSYLATYAFKPNIKYGIVYFGGDVVSSTGIQIIDGRDENVGGYYFFAHGVDLADPTNLTNNNNMLIPIKENDIIIKTIDLLFRYSKGSSDSFMWSRD